LHEVHKFDEQGLGFELNLSFGSAISERNW